MTARSPPGSPEALARDAHRVLAADRRLRRIVEHHGPIALEPRPFASAFEPLARSIVYQQLSGKAAATIHRRLAAAFGEGEMPEAGRVAAAGVEALRTVGLSRRKAEYLRALAQAERAGALPTRAELAAMDDEAIIQALTAHRGVGRWTAQMILMAWMGRADVMPVDDLGIRRGVKIIDALEELPTPAAVLERAERWRPYRTIAAYYLWRASDVGTLP